MPISVIAEGLKLLTLQGIAVQQGHFLVPTLDGTVVRVSPNGGSVTPLVNFLEANLGVPFAISPDRMNGTASQETIVVTVSGYRPDHYLIRVKPDGTYVKLVDLTQVCTDSGAPFGVATDQENYFVTISTDVVEATGQIVQVNAAGTLTGQIQFHEKGNPFGIAVYHDELIVAQSKGLLLRVTRAGKVTKLVDLQQAGFGIPFFVAIQGDRAIVTTNLGWVVSVDFRGNVAAIANIREAKFGIPSGVVADQNALVVTTNSGYVLRLSA